ncbi:hypothetical protein C8Q74DRAFT_1222056 [Fomes fomentarius]|nr:hypothetical protein C8Q74DRAFT_1222056 [Fomes fomentarius]
MAFAVVLTLCATVRRVKAAPLPFPSDDACIPTPDWLKCKLHETMLLASMANVRHCMHLGALASSSGALPVVLTFGYLSNRDYRKVRGQSTDVARFFSSAGLQNGQNGARRPVSSDVTDSSPHYLSGIGTTI